MNIMSISSMNSPQQLMQHSRRRFLLEEDEDEDELGERGDGLFSLSSEPAGLELPPADILPSSSCRTGDSSSSASAERASKGLKCE